MELSELGIVRRCVSFLIKNFDYKSKELHTKSLKELATTIRTVEGIMPAFVDVLFEHLRREDCDLRLGVLQIGNYFFQRSHNFRLELINFMQDFLVYTLETDPLHYPLPKPPDAAKLLKQESLGTLRLWIEKFGAGYPKLQRLENFLKNSKCFDWQNSDVKLMIDREREEKELFQSELRAKKLIEHLTKLFGESRLEIERIQVEAHALIELLSPRFCSLERKSDEFGDGTHNEASPAISQTVMGSSSVSIYLQADGIEIEKTGQNEDLINSFKDTAKQLEKWHAKLSNWLKKLTELGDSSALTRRIIDTKHALDEELQKCREIKITLGKQTDDECSSTEESDSDDFLEVEEKEGYEPEFTNESEILKNSRQSLDDFNAKPGPSGLCREHHALPGRGEGETLTAKKDTNCPPKLAMGLDLKYWGQKDVRPAERTRVHDGREWWIPNNDDIAAPTESAESYAVRQITFVNEMPAIERQCRAPLPSGKLCPRMERFRCALHGPIVERDGQGFPLSEQKHLEMAIAQQKKQEKRDEEDFLQDVEAVTGAELTTSKVKTKGRTARSRQMPVDLETRKRLEAKLFDRRALKRVSTTLDQMQKARADRKFAHQFNYALERR